MEKNIERINNVDIKYADNVVPDRSREQALINNANTWIDPFIKEFNEQKGVIELFLNEKTNHISFSNITNDLDFRLREYVKIFSYPDTFLSNHSM